jgi:hypothetical protein
MEAVDLHKTERCVLHKPGFVWRKQRNGNMDIRFVMEMPDPLCENIKTCIDRSGKTALGDVLGMLTDCWLAANPAVVEPSSPAPSPSPSDPPSTPSPQPGEGTSSRCRHNRNVKKRSAASAWEENEAQVQSRQQVAKAASKTRTEHYKKAKQTRPNPPTAASTPTSTAAPAPATSTCGTCGNCMPELVSIGHVPCTCSNHSTQPEVIDLTAQPATDRRNLPRSRATQRDVLKTIQKRVRMSASNCSEATQANITEVLRRRQARVMTAKEKKQAKKQKLQKHNRHCKSLLDQFNETLNTHNGNFPDNKLDMADIVTFHHMQHDHKLTKLMAQPQFRALKKAWEDEGMTALLQHLTLHQDEALLLKEKMMVSYAGWDELKREMGLKGGKHGEMPNSADLKALAKIYNHALKDKLDFTPITQADEEGTVITKGYRINMQKLHKWIVDQALYHGKQQAHAVQMLA